jgi:hypothetical protein
LIAARISVEMVLPSRICALMNLDLVSNLVSNRARSRTSEKRTPKIGRCLWSK